MVQCPGQFSNDIRIELYPDACMQPTPDDGLQLARYMAGKDCCLARPCRYTGRRLRVPADAGNNP